MKRARRIRISGRRLAVYAVAAATLLAVVFSQAGCTQVQRVPQIEQAVKQFWLGLPGTVPQMALDHELPPTDLDLSGLVRAFNSSTVETWDHQNPTIPSMLVLLVLEDDTEIWIALNGQFGASHAEMAVRPIEGGVQGPFEQYWIRSSALVEQAARLGREYLSVTDMAAVDPEGVWLLK
jgi:hypothetical protein